MLTRNKKRLLENIDEGEIKNKRVKFDDNGEPIIETKKIKNIVIEEEVEVSHNNPISPTSSEEDVDESYEEEDSDSDTEYDLSDEIEKLKSVDKLAYENFLEVSTLLSCMEPNVLEILKTPLKPKDKAQLVELYELYKTTNMPSEEGISLRTKIKKMFKKFKDNYAEYSQFSEDQIKAFKEESRRIKGCQPKLDFKHQILSLDTSKENKLVIYKKFKDLDDMSDGDESSKMRTWLKWALNIPHNRVKENTFRHETISAVLNRVKENLDKELYGMNNVKEQLMLFLNSKLQNKNMSGCSIGLLGPPGTGKTSIAKVLSKCLDFPFEQISFGGVSDPEFLTGHDYTYIGSRPGEIVRCLSRMGAKNGIIFLDEFEKVSSKKGITSTLLHLTDFSQNHEFRDNYLADITIDLSNIWFIYSMNSLPEDAALRDRIFVINVEGYEVKDKVKIVQNYLLPKAVKNIGISEGDITISEENALYLINKVDKCREATGVRTLEKCVKDIVNKIHFLVSNKKEGELQIGFSITFDVKGIKEYPCHISKECIDKFIPDDKRNDIYLSMYI